MIHLKFDLDQIKMSKSFDFSKKIECIIKIINDMLNKLTLVYMNEKIRTKRGLVQGSVLSPLLFNI